MRPCCLRHRRLAPPFARLATFPFVASRSFSVAWVVIPFPFGRATFALVSHVLDCVLTTFACGCSCVPPYAVSKCTQGCSNGGGPSGHLGQRVHVERLSQAMGCVTDLWSQLRQPVSLPNAMRHGLCDVSGCSVAVSRSGHRLRRLLRTRAVPSALRLARASSGRRAIRELDALRWRLRLVAALGRGHRGRCGDPRPWAAGVTRWGTSRRWCRHPPGWPSKSLRCSARLPDW